MALCLSFPSGIQKLSCLKAKECPQSQRASGARGTLPSTLPGESAVAPLANQDSSSLPSPTLHTAGRATGATRGIVLLQTLAGWLGFLGNLTLRALRLSASLQGSSSSLSSRSGRWAQEPMPGTAHPPRPGAAASSISGPGLGHVKH